MTTADQTFKHPVSGKTFSISKFGGELWEHNKTPHAYLVILASTGLPVSRITASGKEAKVGANIKISNYHKVDVPIEKPSVVNEVSAEYLKSLPVDSMISVTLSNGFVAKVTKVNSVEWKDNDSSKNAGYALKSSVELATILAPYLSSITFDIPNKNLDTVEKFINYITSQGTNSLAIDLAAEFVPSHTGKGYTQIVLAADLYQGNTEGYKAVVKYLAKPDFVVVVDQCINKIVAAKSALASDLSTSQKITSTKVINRLEDFKAFLLVAQEVHAGNVFKYDPPNFPDDKERFPLDIGYALTAVSKRNAELIVIKKFGFDVFNASREQYVGMINTAVSENPSLQDFSWVQHAEASHLCRIALYLSGVPGYSVSNSFLAMARKKACINQIKSEVESFSDLTLVYNPRGMEFPTLPHYLGMDAGEWNVVKYALSTEFSDSSTKPFNLSPFNYGALAKYVPDGVYENILSVTTSESIVSAIILYLLLSGLWYAPEINTFETHHPSHNLLLPLEVGVSIYRSKSDKDVFIMVPKLHKSGYVTGIDHSSYISVSPSYSFDNSLGDDNPSWEIMHKASSAIEYADAVHEGFKFSVHDWVALENFEKHPQFDLSGTQILAVKNAVQPLGLKVSELSPAVKCLIAADPGLTEIILFKDKWGHYPKVNDDWAKFQDKVKAFQGINDPSDVPSVNSYIGNLSLSETCEHINLLHASNHYSNGDALGAKMALRQALINWKEEAAKKALLLPETGVSGDLMPIPSLGLGGGQVKAYFVDLEGDTYMGKPNPIEKFRPDAEFGANEIARMFGLNVPSSAVRVVNGAYMHIQKLIPNVNGSLDYVSYKTLDDSTLAAALKSHPVNWSISNHDLHGGNFLLASDGLHNVDFGQTWKALGKDELKVGWELPGNYGGVWFEDYYRDVQAGKVPVARLNKMTRIVLRKAKAVTERFDARYSEILNGVLANREVFPSGMNKESFHALAMQRKHDVFADFWSFYKEMYAKGGYEFTFTLDSFQSGRIEGTDAHVKIDDAFAEQVAKNGVFGKSLFFADPEIEDAHAFFYTVQHNGKMDLQIDFKVRAYGNKAIEKWASAYHAGSQITLPSNPTSVALPMHDEVINALVGLAKTVSHHKNDKAYNKDTINNASKIMVKLVAFDMGVVGCKNSGSVHHSFVSHSHQDFWISWSAKIMKLYADINTAMDKGDSAPIVSSTIYTHQKEATPVEKKPETPNYVILTGAFSTIKTSAVKEDGITEFTGTQTHCSKSYHISSLKNPNVKIQYSPHQFTGKVSGNYTNQGRMQITLQDWDQSSVQIDEVVEIVREMGLTLEPATEHSLQLFFWRHLRNIMGDRVLSAKERQAYDSMYGIKADDSEDELNSYKAGFTKLWGKDVVDAANWHPQFSDFRAHFLEPVEDPEDRIKSGRPYWMRPDFSLDQYEKDIAGVLPSRIDDGVSYLINGGYAANEEKIRWTGGWNISSNSADSDRQKGSSQFAFVRQGYLLHDNNCGFYLEPYVMGRTHNYAYSSDLYGDTGHRIDYSPFNLSKSAHMGYGNKLSDSYKTMPNSHDSCNEVMVKYGWSTWDDIAIICVPNQGERQIILNFYKSRGIDDIRGISIESRIVYTQAAARATMKKIWAMYKV